MTAVTVISPVSVFAENTAVYEDFNQNDVNGKVTVQIPEDTTAEIKITFTSPEVTDEPYYIASMTAGSSQSFDIEGRDTTEDDYRNYTLTVAITGGQYEDTVTYTDTFTVPDGNDNPDSFMQFEYVFTADEIYTGSSWDISENGSQKNITVHFGAYTKGDVNGDGFIDAVDATSVLVEYAGNSTGGSGTFTERQKLSADVNDDGFIDAVDATQILVYYAQLSTGGNPSWISGNSTGTTTTDDTPKTTTSTAVSEGTTTTTTTATHSLTIDYSSYVNSINMLAGSHDDTITIHRYYVHDINGDGIYELITEMGTSEEDDIYSVYSMKSGEMTFAGDIEAGYSYLSIKDGTLYKVYGQGQTADVDKILFDGKNVVSETVGKETDVDTGTFLNAYEWSDTSGIKNIGKNTVSATTATTTTTTTTTAPQTTIITAVATTPDYVYRTKSGKKYHYENPCGNGTYYEVSFEEALSAGLEPCEKCVMH